MAELRRKMSTIYTPPIIGEIVVLKTSRLSNSSLCEDPNSSCDCSDPGTGADDCICEDS